MNCIEIENLDHCCFNKPKIIGKAKLSSENQLFKERVKFLFPQHGQCFLFHLSGKPRNPSDHLLLTVACITAPAVKHAADVGIEEVFALALG